MTIGEFAVHYHLKLTKDSCGDLVILGKARQTEACHIFDSGNGRLGVCLMIGHRAGWNAAKRKALAAGLTLKQDATCEGTLTFDPTNAVQVRLAIKLAGIRQRRVMSEEQRVAASARLKEALGLRKASAGTRILPLNSTQVPDHVVGG